MRYQSRRGASVRPYDRPAPGSTRSQYLPARQGLYDPSNEHDACGIGFVANLHGSKSHDIVDQALQILINLDHRGAVGADPTMGDGAGILVQMPHALLSEVAPEAGIDLPELGEYGAANVFLPNDPDLRQRCEGILEKFVAAEGQQVLGWRDMPVDRSVLSDTVRATEPVIRQLFVGRGPDFEGDQDAFDRKLFVIRRQAELEVAALGDERAADFYVCSLSTRVLGYKGMILGEYVGPYYDDLSDPRLVTSLALVHQRFSTNTFPSWSLAQPFRMICHNGEINTLRGNLNWMNARRAAMQSSVLGDDLEKLWPLIPEGQSDSAGLDNALELLVRGGYSLAHAMMMLIPEAWEGNRLMDPKRRAFYEYHAALMEPWDGPASIAFTDGRQVGATLDRNGLRPSRYVVTDDGLVILASEAGVLPIPEEKIVKKWRLQPGRMLLIDTEEGRIIDDEEIKAELASTHPYQEILDRTQVLVEDLPECAPEHPNVSESLLDRQQAFGYTQESLRLLLAPMASEGKEATGSMGDDTPIAAMSDRPKLLYSYFRQRFAQVTNPAIDPIRESLVMSLVSMIGPRPNLLELDDKESHMRLEARKPILTNHDLDKIRCISKFHKGRFQAVTLDTTYPVEDGPDGLSDALEALCRQAEEAVLDGDNIIVLSDRRLSAERIAIPALLATGAVHHHLIRRGLRTQVGLVVETGDAHEVHHLAVLGGYGAEGINPYMAFETLTDMVDRGDLPEGMSVETAHENYVKAAGKGLLKVMSKMGISTFQSYCGAQIFDALGLQRSFVDKYFFGTPTAIEGIGLAEVAQETFRRHQEAFGTAPVFEHALDPGGDYQFRLRGERHYWTPDSVASLQHAVRGNAVDRYREYARHVNDQSERLMTPRGLFDLKPSNAPVPLDEVEPAEEIVKRFATGAMSFGALSREAHTNLAIAMNRMGAKSNSGEGGEEPDRFKARPNGDHLNSAIKQVASGRFGVTTEYLMSADVMQIKIAQGAKPGEGGQLPGFKVDGSIAKVRHSTPGVGLISPPPHHDIYSIEDLAQLIYDLKNVNPGALVSVKLVSEIGVGTVAAGVSKAHSDRVTIAGHDGGTGASPRTSIHHAGSPWEIGLAETQQTLVLNRLRGRITVQVDGGLRTGRDVVIGALLGADEFGFSTAPLIASGCIMMRKCHLNTCPVGVATQDPELRKRFTGLPEHVINYFFFLAEEVRELMAELGFRTFEEMIGRFDRLDMRRGIEHYKAHGLDLTPLLTKPEVGPEIAISNTEQQEHDLDTVLDRTLIEQAMPALEHGTPVRLEHAIRNTDRTTGAMLSGEVARRYGHAGLPDETIHVKLTGNAGQSFGAWLAHGITLELSGDANDYVGKGLSGGRIMVYPQERAAITPERSMIVGNVVLYGAITGEAYFRGVAAERFAVRNSGAWAVVEGVGDHGCEYMTGGVVVVLGPTGRNFAAGMSGGIAYVLDDERDFSLKVNPEMVELEHVVDERTPEERAADAQPDAKLSEVARDMRAQDASRLHRLLVRHAHHTGSERAREILEKWDEYLPSFVKVMPTDFRRALTKLAKDAGTPGEPRTRPAYQPKPAVGSYQDG
ncbi:MAG: glutamate synthase large subunit [Gemmatimonadota bacterium]|nr:glutamate synthase large subunit [Gemmatimonadota bacterium]